MLDITFNDDDTIKSYGVNQKKLDTMLLTAGFFASKTIGVDFDPLQAMNNYGMRDEQEKCFALQNGPFGHDRLGTWSEGGKKGRMFIYFVGLILASYVRSVWQSNEVLRKKFTSTEASSPCRDAVPPRPKSRIWNYRYIKLKNSELIIKCIIGSYLDRSMDLIWRPICFAGHSCWKQGTDY